MCSLPSIHDAPSHLRHLFSKISVQSSQTMTLRDKGLVLALMSIYKNEYNITSMEEMLNLSKSAYRSLSKQTPAVREAKKPRTIEAIKAKIVEVNLDLTSPKKDSPVRKSEKSLQAEWLETHLVTSIPAQ